MNCKICQSALPDLLLDPGSSANSSALAHMAACDECADQFASLSATFAMLDEWKAPEVSPYFDQKLAVRLREEQAAPAAGWFEQLKTRLLLNTGRQFRPALAGALALVLLVGGGSFGVSNLASAPHPTAAVQASAAVTDLQILDRNEQALQQMDLLLQDDAADDSAATPPHS